MTLVVETPHLLFSSVFPDVLGLDCVPLNPHTVVLGSPRAIVFGDTAFSGVIRLERCKGGALV